MINDQEPTGRTEHRDLGSEPSRLVQALIPAALFALLLAAYVRTLMPGLGMHWDSARFSFIGRFLGVPHPTGYPGYLMLNHLFTRFFPVGSLAFRANLLSAVYAAAACTVAYACLRVLGVRRSVAFATGLALGLTRTLWSQSVVAEVYTMHLLFVAATVYFLLRWSRDRRNHDLVLGCAVYALSFGNHMTTVTLLPAVAFVALATKPSIVRNVRVVTAVAIAIAIGAAQYAYLFWVTADLSRPYIEIPVRNWDDLILITTGAGYKARMFDFGLAELLGKRVPLFIGLLLKQFDVLLGVILVGLLTFRRRREHAFLILAFLGTTIFALDYRIRDSVYYFIPSYFFLALYLGLGIEYLWVRFGGRIGPIIRGTALVGMVVTMFCLNFGVVDLSSNTRIATFVKSMIRTADSDALILVDDHGFTRFFDYYLIGEGWNERGVHAVYRPSNVRAYLEGKQSISLPDERKVVAPGRDLFVVGLSYAQELSEQGLRIVGIRKDVPIFRVELDAESTTVAQ